MNLSDVADKLNALLRGPRKTRRKSELSKEERAEYDETGCGEGYQWYLRHQGLPCDDETGKKYYRYIGEYHRWMRDKT